MSVNKFYEPTSNRPFDSLRLPSQFEGEKRKMTFQTGFSFVYYEQCHFFLSRFPLLFSNPSLPKWAISLNTISIASSNLRMFYARLYRSNRIQLDHLLKIGTQGGGEENSHERCRQI